MQLNDQNQIIARSYELIANKEKNIVGLSLIAVNGIGRNNDKLPPNEIYNILDILYKIDYLDRCVLDNLK